MFGKNRKDTPNVQKAVAVAASFEVTIGELARKSERRAWFVAFGSMLMSLALAGGYYFMLPLKEKIPYVVMADPFSGTASVAALISRACSCAAPPAVRRIARPVSALRA